MTTSNCSNCSLPFHLPPNFINGWFWQCPACGKDQGGPTPEKMHAAWKANAEAFFNQQAERQRAQQQQYAGAGGQNQNAGGGYARQAPLRPQIAAIPPDILKRLIYLCHPDKHAGSDTSKTVTQWLLNQR